MAARLLLLILAHWAISLSACEPHAAKDSAAAPCRGCNLVLISLDTLGADHVGAYGYPRRTTPRIDALAKRSVLFEDAISQSAWTRPSHTSMLTGLYPSEHGIVRVHDNVIVPPEAPTLASVLRENGYATAGFTGGANMSPHFGLNRGFDVYEVKSKHMSANVAPALRWIDDEASEPFFLFLHGFEPHRPYRASARDREAFGAGSPEELQRLCESNEPPDDREPYVGVYDAAIRAGDRVVGRFLDGLKKRGLLDRTIVIFTSDHGEEIFQHGGCYHVKTLYGEILRVPFLVSVPSVDARRVAGPVPASVATAPTALELLGVERGGIAGPSLAPTILRGEPPSTPLVVSETESVEHGLVRSVTGAHQKLIHWVSGDRREFFDLAADPEEQAPLRDDDRGVTLSAALDDWTASHPPIAAPVRAKPLPWRLQKKLIELGYVE